MDYQNIIAIYACKKYEKRLNALKLTWLKQLDGKNKVLFFFADDGYGAREEGDIVYLSCLDGYEHLPRKTWELIRHCVKHYTFDGIIKIDDDIYIPNMRKIIEEISGYDYSGQVIAKNRNKSPMWHAGKVVPELEIPVPDYLLQYQYCKGGVYSLSRKAAECIADISPDEIPEFALPVGYEDVMVGRLVDSINNNNNNSLSIKNIDHFFISPKEYGQSNRLKYYYKYLCIEVPNINDFAAYHMVAKYGYPVTYIICKAKEIFRGARRRIKESLNKLLVKLQQVE